ncbi:MAG: MMPL family transporter [Magnetococcus sp. WYHC-3]
MLNHTLLLGLRHPRMALFLVLLLVASCAAGLPRLSLHAGLDGFLREDDPGRQILAEMSAKFGDDAGNLVVLSDPHLWEPEHIASLAALTRELQRLPFVAGVEGLLDARKVHHQDGAVTLTALFDPLPQTPAALHAARREVLRNPLLVGEVLSPDGETTALWLRLRPGTLDATQVDSALDAALLPYRQKFATLFQLGAARIDGELTQAVLSDLVRLTPLSALTLLAAIWLFLRSGSVGMIPLVTASLSILATLGLMGWLDITLNVLTVMVPPLLMVIGSTEDTYLISGYLHAIAPHNGQPDRPAAVAAVMSQMGTTLLLTAGTTLLGFASNITAPVALVRDFALAASLGIFINTIITLLLVPLILARFGPRRSRLVNPERQLTGLPAILIDAFAHLVTHHPRLILSGATLMVLYFGWHAQQLHVTNDPLAYFRADHPLVMQTNRLHEDLAGARSFNIIFSSTTPGLFLEPQHLATLEHASQLILQRGLWDSSRSIVDFLHVAQRELHGSTPGRATLPENTESVRRILEHLPETELRRWLDADAKSARMRVRHNIHESRLLLDETRLLRSQLERIAGADVRVQVVGLELLTGAAALDLMHAQLESLAMLVGMIFVMMSLMFTSLKGGLISLIPNLIPIVTVFGLVALWGIPLNPGATFLAVIAIGIATDDTIHMLTRYNEERRHTPSAQLALRNTLHAEAIPITTTSLALMLGFGVLTLSQLTLVAQLGALLALTMLLALVSELLITPVLLSRFQLVGLAQILALKVRREVLETSPLFEGMSPLQIKRAILISELYRFRAGDVVVRQGRQGSAMALILTGRMEVVRHDQGNSRVLAVLGPGEVFGEIGFVQALARTADVRALEDVELLIFSAQRMRERMGSFPRLMAQLNLNISRILGQRLAQMVARGAASVAPVAPPAEDRFRAEPQAATRADPAPTPDSESPGSRSWPD